MVAGKRGSPSKPKGSAAKSSEREITDDDLRALAAQQRPKYERILAAKKAADKALQDIGKTIKSDLGEEGLAIIKAMIELDTPEGEAKVKARVRAQATALSWSSHQLGTQILLALEDPDRTPATDRAFDEGLKASLDNKPRKPPYDPSVPQYTAWMNGFSSHQEKLAAKIGRGNDETDVRPEFLRLREADRLEEEKTH